jgi:hypothetical protein
MLAYLFWHVPSAGTEPRDYESALLAFQADLAGAPPPGFVACATYRISEVPWLDNHRGYEDWYLVASSAALDALNQAAVRPQRWDVHAAIASRMGPGHGGLYHHVFGDGQTLAGARAVWMTRPRGIRYEPVLREVIDGARGFLSCWRRQMVLGPADEFVITGTPELKVSPPKGWQARTVERTVLSPERRSAETATARA